MNKYSVRTPSSTGYPARPSSKQSDHTSSEGSPVHQKRRQRPHSMAGLTPSYTPGYASATVSSNKRLGRNTDKKITGKTIDKWTILFQLPQVTTHHRVPSEHTIIQVVQKKHLFKIFQKILNKCLLIRRFYGHCHGNWPSQGIKK